MWHRRRPPALAHEPGGEPEAGAWTFALLDLAPTALLVCEGSSVRYANGAARRLGLVADGRLANRELAAVARRARREREAHAERVAVGGRGLTATVVEAAARRLDGERVALVARDVTGAERIESLRRDFVANVSHEIKTPVGALTLLAEAALEAWDSPPTARRFVEQIGAETARLRRLVEDLLELSRLQGGEPVVPAGAVDLDTVVAEAIERTAPSASARRITVVTGGEPGLRVRGNAGQLASALVNLLDNAIAYSDPGTRVAVGVHPRDATVEVAVSDEGIGIPAAHLDRVFERFYRVDPARSRDTGGTGLGLAIVKHVAQNHGGSVRVWSRPGQGSTFTLVLPRLGG